MKRVLSVVLSLALLLTVITVSANTTAEKTGITFTDEYFYRTNKAYDSPIVTFEAEIRLSNGYTENAGRILGNDSYLTKGGQYSFLINTNGMPHLYVVDTNYTHDEYKFNKVNVATGEWVHLAIVRDVEADLMKCYVDGEYVQSLPLSGKTYTKAETPYVIGGDFSELNLGHFKGEIRSIKLYSDVRTELEIKSDMLFNDLNDLMAYYDLSGINPESDKIIADESSNDYDAVYERVWLDEMPDVGDYDYSMIVVGDQQMLNELYTSAGDMDTMYDHIIDFGQNPDNKLEYVFNLGDITNKSLPVEWDTASYCFDRLTDAGIDYTFIRGNHDTVDTFNAALTYEKYGKGIVDGTFCGDMTSFYRKVVLGGVKYLILVLDYGANDHVLNWASDVVKAHSDYNVIMATHGYIGQKNYDGTIFFESENADVYNDGMEMWEEFVSKHENISLVLCGHTLTEKIMLRKDTGVNGNTVTTMLVNPQSVDYDAMYKTYGYDHGSGLLAHLYFSNGGKDVQVRYYSTVLKKWYRSESQFSTSLDLIGDDYLSGADFN